MEIDFFPVTSPQATLQQALDLMEFENRSGVVVDAGYQCSFVRAGEVVVAMVEKTAGTLEPLADKNPISFVAPPDVGLPYFDFREGAPHVALEKYLNARQLKFALIALSSTRAIVASRHEDDMPEHAKPRNCYCRTDYKAVSPGTNGGNCPYDSRHAGTVRCR